MSALKKIILMFIYPVLECMPFKLQNKIKIILNVLINDWRMLPYPTYLGDHVFFEFKNISEDDINDSLHGLDEKSIDYVRRYIKGQCMYYVPEADRCFYSMKDLFTREEEKTGLKLLKKLNQCRKQYKLGSDGDLSSLIFHHGLAILPPNVLNYIRGKVFIDAGSYIGDSSLTMLLYEPFLVVAFDPSAISCEKYHDTMKNNHVPESKYEMVKAGLGDVDNDIVNYDDSGLVSNNLLSGKGNDITEIKTLDSFFSNREEHVGFIKADVEGMGVSMLRGSIETIKRDRPVLSLAIYHNRDELFETYGVLSKLNLNYTYSIHKFSLPWENVELVLLGIPNEIMSGDEYDAKLILRKSRYDIKSLPKI